MSAGRAHRSRRAAALERIAAVPPVWGAAVMATGIVSVALSSAGALVVSAALMWLSVALWALLAVAAAARLVLRGRPSSPAALTAVAATCVVGARVTAAGAGAAGAAALALAAVLLLGLAGPLASRVRRPASGSWFLLTVAPAGLGVLAAALAAREHARWLAWAALAAVALAAAAYARVLAAFDRGQLARGHGDQWVAGGAAAICALALADAGRALGAPAALQWLAGAAWLVAAAWLPALLAGELRAPRRGYDPRRWATVFPVGMYAAMTAAVGELDRLPALRAVARGGAWVALAVWLAVAAGAVRALLRGDVGG